MIVQKKMGNLVDPKNIMSLKCQIILFMLSLFWLLGIIAIIQSIRALQYIYVIAILSQGIVCIYFFIFKIFYFDGNFLAQLKFKLSRPNYGLSTQSLVNSRLNFGNSISRLELEPIIC